MRRFFGRLFTSAPGLIALVLVLGGIATAASPVFNGNVFAGGVANWINTYAYGANGTPIVSQSSSGQVASTSASRTSDQSGAPGSAVSIGSIMWGFNDKTGGYTSWAQYSEARSYNYASVGPTITNEQDITNFGASAQQFDPYKYQYGQSSGNATMNLWLGSGGSCTVSSPCYNPNGGGTAASTTASLAIGIINNGSDYLQGINFGYNALHGNDGKTVGQTAPAIVMPEGDTIRWDYCDNTTSYPADCTQNNLGASMWSQVTSNASSVNLVFANSGIQIQQNGSGGSLQVNSGAVYAGAGGGATFNPGDLVSSETPTCGAVRLGGSGSEGILDFGCNSASLFTLDHGLLVSGAVVAGTSTAPTYNGGDLVASESTTCGVARLGGSSSHGNIDWGCTHSNAFTLPGWTYIVGTVVPTNIGQTASCANTACRAAMTNGVYTWTFGTAYNSTPSCTATEETNARAVAITAISTTAVTFTSSTTTGNSDELDMHCIANPS